MVEGKSAGYVAVQMLKAKRIALLTSDNDFGRTLAEGFKEYIQKYAKEVKIVYAQTYPFKEKDFNDIGEVVKEVQVQIVKEGRFRHFGVVTDMNLITP
jgi:branched-chain amino acid transport system substrate-binding protein